jgi:hypothetical protein
VPHPGLSRISRASNASDGSTPKADELDSLVERVARAYRVPEHEIPIMIETARGDQENAWICFRSLAAELGLDVQQ